MADITMCMDTECFQNRLCYRYVALPNEYWQSYFVDSPKKMDGCAYFSPIRSDDVLPTEERHDDT